MTFRMPQGALPIALANPLKAGSGRIAPAGGVIPPSDVFARAGSAGIWLDPSDTSLMYQNPARTVPLTADGQDVASFDSSEGNSHDMYQHTTSGNPSYKTNGAQHWLAFDGVFDSLFPRVAITDFTANMHLFYAYQSDEIVDGSNEFIVLSSGTQTTYVGVAKENDTGTNLGGNAGTPVFHVNGVALDPQLTRDDLWEGLHNGGAPTVLQVSNLDMTNGDWQSVRLGRYAGNLGFPWLHKMYGVGLIDAPTTADKTDLEAYFQSILP